MIVRRISFSQRKLAGYVQSHVVAQEGIRLPWGVSEHDGQAELWFDSIDEMNAAAFNKPSFLAEVHPGDETFIDMEGCKLMVVEEQVKVAGEAVTSKEKVA